MARHTPGGLALHSSARDATARYCHSHSQSDPHTRATKKPAHERRPRPPARLLWAKAAPARSSRPTLDAQVVGDPLLLLLARLAPRDHHKPRHLVHHAAAERAPGKGSDRAQKKAQKKANHVAAERGQRERLVSATPG